MIFETSTDPEPRDWRFPFIYYVLYGILPDNSKEAAVVRRKVLNSITMRLCKYYIACRMMESCFAVFHTKRHMKHSGKFMMICAELTNPNPNLGTDSENLAIIGRRWFLMPSPTLSNVVLVRSMVTSSIKYQVIFIQFLLHSHLRCAEWMSLDP